jgi:hypothetical protein
MKTLAISILTLFISQFHPGVIASAQEKGDCIEQITNAIKLGSAEELAKNFNNTIDLSVPDKDGTFSNVQAELIVKDFFRNNKVQSFKINHKGSSNDGSKYAIGTMNTSSNSYRIYFLIKNSSGKELIHQMEIEEE